MTSSANDEARNEVPLDKLVERLASRCIPEQEIATIAGVDVEHLREQHGAAMERGRAKATSVVANQLFALVEEGNTAAVIFMAKALLNLSDRPPSKSQKGPAASMPANVTSLEARLKRARTKA